MKSLFLLPLAFTFLQAEVPGLPEFRQMCDSIEAYVQKLSYDDKPVYVKKANVSRGKKKKSGTLVLTFNDELAFHPFRDGDIEHIYDITRRMIPGKYAIYRKSFIIKSNKHDIRDYRPYYYSANDSKIYVNQYLKSKSEASASTEKPALVERISSLNKPAQGLSNAHIALWQSHGCYFEPTLERWEWQRARLFGVVEDSHTQSYVLQYLVPMLENAGAVVLMPRERDVNTNEVIVDNDTPSSGYSEDGKWSQAPLPGFAAKKEQYLQGENPFKDGSARYIASTNKKSATKIVASWVPDIPESGEYGVYVSYQKMENSATDARYLVRHSGGETWFSVNQTMCSETWVYLGRFRFDKKPERSQGVFLSNFSKRNKTVISADAVRFGGGMGNIARSVSDTSLAECSGQPRFNEAARYWLQWAGFSDSIYTDSSGKDDYKDDLKSRGKWVNTLKNQYGVPVDLSFALHTDAGVRISDSIVGTLAIYTGHHKTGNNYPSGLSKMACKEYADIVQSQVVDDIRNTFGIDWTRRGIWDRSYNESSSPQVPSMLLELLSHQNFWDMRLGLDPNFRFVASRAIYKGILRFYSYLNDAKYAVQPLPVKDFSASVVKSGKKNYAQLTWTPVEDPLEPTAKPEFFVVYTRVDGGGFDNGIKFTENCARIEIKPGYLYSFKVVAGNDGGIGFPSETLCAAVADKQVSKDKKMLIVNNFNHISAPSSFVSQDSLLSGFRYDLDPGIPYVRDISYCGPQFEFNRLAEWKDDDDPGHGASLSNYETTVVAGNTFDYAASHAKAALHCGYDIVSSSSDAFTFLGADTANCAILDIICGRMDSTGRVFNRRTEEMISSCQNNGCGIILSGADVASDIWNVADSLEMDWYINLTSSKLMTRYATSDGTVRGIANHSGLNPRSRFHFFSEPNPTRYCVPQPDAIIPARENCSTIYRYAGNNMSAGTFRNDSCRIATLGFPIEALENQDEIDALISELLKLFE